MIYQKYMLTSGILWADGDFTPKILKDCEEAIEREGEGEIKYALMGLDPNTDRWDVLMSFSSVHGLVRRVMLMFGTYVPIQKIDDGGIEFERAYGIDAVMYRNDRGERTIVFGGLLSGMMAATEDDPVRWGQAFELCKRLGLAIKPATGYDGPVGQW